MSQASGDAVRPVDDSLIVTMTEARFVALVRSQVEEALAEHERQRPPEPKWLSGAQMALRLGISRTKLHFLRVKEGCPALRLGDVYKFDPKAVEEWLRERST